MNLPLEMALTAALATTTVTLWTVRIAVTARGSKAWASALAAIEAMLFIVAFSRLIGGLDSPHLIVAYGTGMAIGTWAGLSLDGKLNPQLSRVDIFDASGEAIDAIVAAGYPFTRSDGFGSEGRVAVASVVTSESRVEQLIDTVVSSGADTFWTVAPVRRADEIRVPGGHRQPGTRALSPRVRHRRTEALPQPTVPQRTHAAAQV
ncbi:MAG: DUF5698 domain-containing protein [Acidimicrobiia bacterium]